LMKDGSWNVLVSTTLLHDANRQMKSNPAFVQIIKHHRLMGVPKRPATKPHCSRLRLSSLAVAQPAGKLTLMTWRHRSRAAQAS
jgi:hypothetical protein